MSSSFGITFVTECDRKLEKSIVLIPKESVLVKPCDHNIKLTIELTQEMIRLADQGDIDREDTGCGILYGMLRDSAYKLWRMAEEEKKRHQAKGWWSDHCPAPSEIDKKINELTVKDTNNEKEDK